MSEPVKPAPPSFIVSLFALIGIITLFSLVVKSCYFAMKDVPQKEVTKEVNVPLRHWDASNLLNEYRDEMEGQLVTVEGVVHSVGKEEMGSKYIMLDNDKHYLAAVKYIKCYISTYSEVKPENIKKGDYVEIKGELGSVFRDNLNMLYCEIFPY